MIVTTRASIAGAWRNQLGSLLTLEVGEDGAVRGHYHAGAGSSPDRAYPVTGFCDPRPIGSVAAIGFVVNWQDNHCVTVWSGKHDAQLGTIETTWLMTTEASAGDEWKATMIGHDVFRGADA